MRKAQCIVGVGMGWGGEEVGFHDGQEWYTIYCAYLIDY